jgi:PAS domain S-box-containing protein
MDERFRQVVEFAPNAMVMIDRAGTIQLVNAETERLFGYARAELLGQKVEILVPERFRTSHPSLRASFFASPAARAMGAGRDLFGLRKDGSEVPVEIGLNPIDTDEGTMVLTAIVDITARKRMEARFRQVVESAPNAMVMIDRAGTIQLVNAETERLFGYQRSELLGQKVEILVPERFRARHPGLRLSFFASPNARAMGAGRDLYGLKKDGSEVPVEIGLNPIDTNEGTMVLAAIVDITARKRMEARFRQVVESAPNAVVMIDRAGTIQLVNAETERLFGYKRDELLGQKVEMLVPERFRANHPGLRLFFFASPNTRAMGAGRDLYGLKRDGSEVPVEIGLNPIDTDDGMMVLATIVDITARKRSELQRNLLASIIQSSDDAIVSRTLDGLINSWNRGAEILFGYSAEEAIGHPVSMFDAPGHEGEMLDKTLRVSRGEFIEIFEIKRRQKDGSLLDVSCKLSPIHDDDGKIVGVSSLIRDITDRVRAKALIERQREELLSTNSELEQFAYIATHDLRAPLRAIQNLAGWIAEDIADIASDETRENLALLQGRCDRLDNLLTGLLDYSRTGRAKVQPEPIDPADLVADIIEYLSPPPNFTIECPKEMAPFMAAKVPLEHVLQNLITNAIKHHDRDEGRIAVSARDLGSHVEFCVEDDGPGIAPAFHERIFGIFQTLRPRDEVEGSGVGLAIVRKAVTANGGIIRVESAPPRRGARFIFSWEKSQP